MLLKKVGRKKKKDLNSKSHSGGRINIVDKRSDQFVPMLKTEPLYEVEEIGPSVAPSPYEPQLQHFTLPRYEQIYPASGSQTLPIPIKIESQLPYFMNYKPVYSDDFLVTDLKRVLHKGSGIRDHHPLYRKVVFDSFQAYPELQRWYVRG